MVAICSGENGPTTKRARLILVSNAIGFILLAPVTGALFLEDLEAAHFFRCYIAPGNGEVFRVEFQLQKPFEEPARARVGASLVQIVQPAMGAAIDGEVPTPTVRTGAGRGRIFDFARRLAFCARDGVGVGTPARSILAAIAQLVRTDRTVDQQPERDWPGPIVRR